jgi:methionyl-tRNA synthetase
MNKDIFYITTPIYYVNDIPHIGHCYTTVIADILARFQRLIGKDVFFLTGTDEHGQKIEKAAESKNMTPIELVDNVVQRYKDLWQKLNISNDYFIRTTDSFHQEAVVKVITKVYENGYIYLGAYEGWYCRPCESYYTESQLVEGNCPDCGRKPVKLQEEAYFFKLSAFQDKILEHIKQNSDFVLPESRKNEVISFVESGLNDLCISRSSISWGIEFPELQKTEKKHYVYVWFDALLNYLTGINYLKNEDFFQKYWSNAVHLIGKDILKFHAVIWPAMLMAMGEQLPKHVFGHGFIYQSGEKMSKSRGNVLDPYSIIDEYGVDAFRYYLTREVVLGLDGSYSDENMKQRYNSDLANDYGNLLNRTLNMMNKYFQLKVPKVDDSLLSELELSLKKATLRLSETIPNIINQFKLSIALEEIFSVIRKTNKFIEETAPWVLAKEENNEKLATVMVHLIEAIRLVTCWLSPFLPSSTELCFQQLNILPNEEGRFSFSWGFFKEGRLLSLPVPIFPRKQ